MAERILDIRFRVTDEGTAVLDKISQKISQVGESAKSMGSSLSLIKWDAIVNLGSRAIQAGEQLSNFLDIGAKSKQTRESFEMIAAAAGVSADKIISEMKAAGAVFVDETDIMQKASRGLMEGLDPKDLVKLMEAARQGARLMGKDVSETYDKMMDSIISLRVRGLKEAGFPMDPGQAYKKFAETLQTVPETLNLVGERQSLVNEVIRIYEERLKTLGPLQANETEQLQTAKSTVESYYKTLSELTWIGLEGLLGETQKVGTWMGATLWDIGIKLAKTDEPMKNFSKNLAGINKETAGLITGAPVLTGKDKFLKPLTIAEAVPLQDISKYLSPALAMSKAYTELNFTSQMSLTAMAVAAVKNLETVKTAFEGGRVPIEDYKNALITANAAITKALPEDKTKALVALDEETSQRLKAINKEEEGWQGRMTQVIDEQTSKRNQILGKSVGELVADFAEGNAKLKAQTDQLNALKIKPEVDTTGMTKEIWSAFESVKAQIESTSINVNVNAGGGGGSSGLYSTNMGMVTGAFADQNLNVKLKFWGEGMSPAMPLGDAFDKLGNRISQTEEDLKGLNFAVDFSSANTSITQTLNKQRGIQEYWNHLISGYADDITKLFGFDPKMIARLADQMKESLDQNFNEQLKELTSYIEASGKSLTGKIWERFMRAQTSEIQAMQQWSQWNPKYTYESFKEMFPGYQMGTHYVPRTGLALVHQGEKIIPKNVRTDYNMGGVTINVNGAGDPKKVAEEVAKVLKYGRSGILANSIRSVR